MNPKLIIFDIDGTLLYSNQVDSHYFSDTYLRLYGKAFPSIDWTTFPHVTDDTIFRTAIARQFDREATQEEMEVFKDEFVAAIQAERKINPQKFQAVKNSKETIELLVADSGYEVGIATGGWRKPAMVKLHHLHIPTDALHKSFADGNPTREDIIQGVLDQTNALKMEFEKIVYVGDASWDVKTTRNMNMPFIGVRRKGDFEKLSSLGAQTIIPDYSDFDAFLQAVEEAQPPQTIVT